MRDVSRKCYDVPVTDATPWLTPEEESTWRQWLALAEGIPAALHAQLQAETELSLQDYDVLVQLTESPDNRLRINALARAVVWERSRLSHHLKRMEKRGLVARESCDDDGRGNFVIATPAGIAAITAAAPGHVAIVRKLFVEPLTARDQGALARITNALHEALNEHSHRNTFAKP